MEESKTITMTPILKKLIDQQTPTMFLLLLKKNTRNTDNT